MDQLLEVIILHFEVHAPLRQNQTHFIFWGVLLAVVSRAFFFVFRLRLLIPPPRGFRTRNDLPDLLGRQHRLAAAQSAGAGALVRGEK